MNKGAVIGIGCLAIVVIAALIIGTSAYGTYNNLVKQQQAVESTWAQVQNAYQRRSDLIPNLVATVKGYASHESEVLEAVTASRSRVGSMQVTPEILNNPAEMQKFQQAQSGLGSALSRLMVVVEKYPDLKANENFRDLQVSLEQTENRIGQERRHFIKATEEYNTTVGLFPGNIFARMFGFQKKAYFQAEAGSEKAPVVNFGK
jgi:LemA protein